MEHKKAYLFSDCAIDQLNPAQSATLACMIHQHKIPSQGIGSCWQIHIVAELPITAHLIIQFNNNHVFLLSSVPPEEEAYLHVARPEWTPAWS